MMDSVHREQPCPGIDDGDERQRELVALEGLGDEAQAFVQGLVPQKATTVTLLQLNWLANLPTERLGEHAREIYQSVADAGYKAFIPLGSWVSVMGEGDEELG